MAKGDSRKESQIDETDRNILRCFIQNPRTTVQGLVEQLDQQYKLPLSESAVQKRLSDLQSQHRLERAMLVRDWAAVGFPFRYRIDVKANMRELRLGRGGPPDDAQAVDSQKGLCSYIKDVLARRYQDRLVILETVILLGSKYDIAIMLRVKDPKTILDFVTEGLRILGGVGDTMTSHEAWTYGEPETET